jgi:hypothetical protein
MYPPFDPPATIEWYRPTTAWFNVPPVTKQTPKRTRDSVDELASSLKRLRTSDYPENKQESKQQEEEEKKVEPKLSTSTALVLARPNTQRIGFVSPRFSSVPELSLPPPVGTFPVVLYRGPPAVDLSKASDAEKNTLSKDNRRLKVSPSFTIELVDDEEEEGVTHSLSPRMNDEIATVQSRLKATTMADDFD